MTLSYNLIRRGLVIKIFFDFDRRPATITNGRTVGKLPQEGAYFDI